MISLGFSLVTLLGFAMVWVLPEPYRGWWARYADSAVLALMALLLIPLPLKILHSNLREVLLITSPDNEIVQRVEAVMQQIRAEHDIAEYSTHIAKTGRIHFIEINMVVGPDFKPRGVPELDKLRARIWEVIGLPLEQAWAQHPVYRRPALELNARFLLSSRKGRPGQRVRAPRAMRGLQLRRRSARRAQALRDARHLAHNINWR